MSWEAYINSVIGKPFMDGGRGPETFDCWGLICDAYQRCRGIVLPSYDFISAANQREAAKAALDYRATWVDVVPGREERGDVALFRPCHVGVVISRGYMLHVDEDLPVCIESFRSPIWQPKLLGIYRYA